MPDWITHIVVAWTLCRILSFKFKEFNSSNTMIVIAGALIPDLAKIVLGLKLIGIDAFEYLAPIHLPTGSFIIAGIISLFFPEKKKTFLFLGLGVLTHYSLDLILEHVSGGIYLFYPFSWWQWQLEYTNSSDYMVTALALCIAGLVYLIGREIDRVPKKSNLREN
jgi:LexA-binding, inner membrane-associated putative hydrolase